MERSKEVRILEIRTEVEVAANGSSKDIVKIVWQGERIAKLIFASGRVIDFTRPDPITLQQKAE